VDNLNADAGANFSGKIFDHCEKIYYLSFMKSLMKVLQTTWSWSGAVHITQNRFCQLFSVTILQIFLETPAQNMCRGLQAGIVDLEYLRN